MKNICLHKGNLKKQHIKTIKVICLGCEVVRLGHIGDWCTCRKDTPYRMGSYDSYKEVQKMDFRGLGKLLI